MVHLAVQGGHLGTSGRRLISEAQEAERLGFETFYVPDHPGTLPSPIASLGAIAEATATIRLGANVINMGVRHPFHVAVEMASLDALSGGRAILGVGAGHTPSEWEAVGQTRPRPPERINRLVECVSIVRPLLRGETVDFEGSHVSVRNARITGPLPLQSEIPLLIGGGNTRLLDFAGRHADRIGLTGLGRTLADGHSHEVRWRPDQIDAAVERVMVAAAGRERPPSLEALVQAVVITDDPELAAAEIIQELPGLSVADALSCPFLLLGTVDGLASQLLSHQERWGFGRFVVRTSAMRDVAPLLELL